MGAKGNLNASSFTNLMKVLTLTNRQPHEFEAVYVKLPNGSFDKMEKFLEQRMLDIGRKTAKLYEASSKHCFTFAMKVANAAGISTDVSSAENLDVVIKGGNFITRNLIAVAVPDFEVPARQLRALQFKYQKLNVVNQDQQILILHSQKSIIKMKNSQFKLSIFSSFYFLQ